MAQIQIPDYVRHNLLRDEQQQNKMLQESQLKTAGLQQQALGIRNEDAMREQQDFAELRNLLSTTAPDQQERVGLEFLRARDPDKASKLEAQYISRFINKARIDPKGAAAELERSTGEKVNVGNRYSEFDVGEGKKVYIDNLTGHIFEPNKAQELAALKADLQKESAAQGQEYKKELEEVKAGLRQNTAGTARTVVSGDRVKQYNPKTGRYDIDVGPAPPRDSSVAGSAGQTQLTTITTPDGPKLVEYKPGRAGAQGTIRIVESGSIKGNVPALSEGTQKEMRGLGGVASSLAKVKTLLPKVQTGPIWGRIKNVQIGSLGGWGATPDEVRLTTQMNMLMRSAFDTAGANFTQPEMNIFRSIYPQNTDTLETAVTKIDEALQFVKERAEINKGLMTPMQRTQTKFPASLGGGSAPPAGGGGEIKIINGVPYQKVPGGWQKIKQ